MSWNSAWPNVYVCLYYIEILCSMLSDVITSVWSPLLTVCKYLLSACATIIMLCHFLRHAYLKVRSHHCTLPRSAAHRTDGNGSTHKEKPKTKRERDPRSARAACAAKIPSAVRLSWPLCTFADPAAAELARRPPVALATTHGTSPARARHAIRSGKKAHGHARYTPSTRRGGRQTNHHATDLPHRAQPAWRTNAIEQHRPSRARIERRRPGGRATVELTGQARGAIDRGRSRRRARSAHRRGPNWPNGPMGGQSPAGEAQPRARSRRRRCTAPRRLARTRSRLRRGG